MLACIESGLLNLRDATNGILHIAPGELGLVRRFSRYSGYRPVDLFPHLYREARAERLDLMELSEVRRYDLIYCSHVLEHVPDYRVVLRNFHCALRPGGEAWILVPLWNKPTEEGDAAMTPRTRERRFGQWDHVRQFGTDTAERLREAGFDVTTITVDDIEPDLADRLGLLRADSVFRCTKV